MSPDEIIGEFRRKYEGTYLHVQMPDSQEENLFFLSSVAQSPGGATLRLESEEFGKIQLNMNTAHTLKFKFPKVGTFQMGYDAYCFNREPRRQWSRGLCNGNCRIAPVWAFSNGIQRANLDGISFGLVQAAFEAKCYKFSQALPMLGTGKFRSVALEDGFAVGLSHIHEGLLLFWRTIPVAALSKDGELTSLFADVYKPQIEKILK